MSSKSKPSRFPNKRSVSRQGVRNAGYDIGSDTTVDRREAAGKSPRAYFVSDRIKRYKPADWDAYFDALEAGEEYQCEPSGPDWAKREIAERKAKARAA